MRPLPTPGSRSGRSIRLSGMSDEKALRRRSCGLRTRASYACGSSGGVSGDALRAGWGSALSWRGSALSRLAGAPATPACSSSAMSVLRNRAARGPSRMLARLALAIGQNLLRKLPVGLGGHAVGLVLEHRHALDGGLGEANGLADARRKHAIAKVFLEDLDRLLGVNGARIHQRREDTLDVNARIEVLADHREGVLQLDEAAHRQILALD